MGLFKFDVAVTSKTPSADLESILDCQNLVARVGVAGEGGAIEGVSNFGGHDHDIRRGGEKGFFNGSPGKVLYHVVDSVNLGSGVKVRVRIEYDVVTLTTAEQAQLAFTCC
jgi:hypothetical protein